MNLLTFIFSLFVLATGSITTPQDKADSSERFGAIITAAAIKLQESASRRPFKIKAMNDSLEKTAGALRLLASRRQVPAQPLDMLTRGPLTPAAFSMNSVKTEKEIMQLLEEARGIYPENSFAVLIQAVTRNAAGDTASANRYFEEYLLGSRTYADFDREFLKWNEFHTLRRYAYELLRTRGVNFKEREKEIRVRVPYEQLLRYVTHPEPQDRILNLFFVAVIFGGGVLLVLASLAGMEFYRSLGFSLLALYWSVWLAYGCWIYDLAFGLPWGWNRYTTAAVFLALGIAAGLGEMLASWREARRPLAEGYKRCPHCKEIIVSLSVECFRCKKKLN